MSFRSSEDARHRALRELAREASDLPMPKLDWDRMEGNLLAEVQKTSGTRRLSLAAPVARAATPAILRATPPRWASSPWPVAFAAAAAGLLVYGVSNSPQNHASVALTTEAAVPHLGMTAAALPQVGDLAASPAKPLSYEKPGVVNFTLAPASRARVVALDSSGDAGGSMTVALEEGSLHADVVPRLHGEAFAVEVGRTRVAVHGTSFTVTREGDRVLVDVTHGSVAVGPVGHPGATQGWLLVGPERAAFSLDGASKAEWLSASLPVVADPVVASTQPIAPPAIGVSVARSKQAHPASRGAVAPGAAKSVGVVSVADPNPEVALVEPPSAAEQERSAISSILSQLGACYEQQATSQGVKFSVESSLKLTIWPSGAVHEGVFSPPLSPTLMGCAEKSITTVRFPASSETREVRVPVRLTRAPR